MSGTFAAKHQHLPSSCDEESKTSILIDEAGVNFQLMEEGVGGHDLSTAETAKDGNIEKPVNGGGELVVIQPTEGKGNDADTTKALKSVSLFEILSFADDTDCTLMSIGFFMACLSGLNQPAQLIIFGSLLDSFNGSTKSDSTKAVSFLALMYLVVAIQIFITNFLQTACMSAASGRQAKRMREVYFRALLRQSIAYYDCRDQGALATSVMERTLVIQDGLGEKLALGVQFTMAFFAGLAVAFYYVWQLALLMVGVVPVLTVLIGIAAKTLSKSSEDSTNAYTLAGSTAQQALGAIRTLYSLGIEPTVFGKYKQELDVAEAAGLRRWRATGLMVGTISMVMWLMYALGLWFGAFLISGDMERHQYCRYYLFTNGNGVTELHQPASNCITGGRIMICFFAVIFGGLNLGQGFPAIAALQSAYVEFAKMIEVVRNESPIDPTSPEGTTPDASRVHGEIELRDVHFAYPMRADHKVYNGMCVKIEAGQTVAFVGPSGCGKSTAVSLIERFYDPAEGAVLLDGTDIRTLNVAWLRKQIGLVSQEPVLFTGTIYENIAYGKEDATVEEVEAAARMSNAHAFITAFPDGYETEVGEKGIQLSGGQKQRIAIARAIVRDPKILILDEATSALDATSERVVQRALDNLLQQKKRTTIIIAHRLSTIRNADKIVVFDKGVVKEEGTHNELIARVGSLYATLVKLQLHSLEDKQALASSLSPSAAAAVFSQDTDSLVGVIGTGTGTGAGAGVEGKIATVNALDETEIESESEVTPEQLAQANALHEAKQAKLHLQQAQQQHNEHYSLIPSAQRSRTNSQAPIISAPAAPKLGSANADNEEEHELADIEEGRADVIPNPTTTSFSTSTSANANKETAKADNHLIAIATTTSAPINKVVCEEPAEEKILQSITVVEEEVEEKTSIISWVWALSAPERGYLYLGLVGSVIAGAAFPLLGFLIAEMIKVFYDFDPDRMRRSASRTAYIFIGIAGSQFMGPFVSQYCFGVITERLARRVRERSFLKMLQMDIAWYDLPKNTAGTLAQQLATDCVMIKALTGERASTSAAQIVTLAVSLAIAFYQCWEMTLVMLGLFPIIMTAFAVQHKLVTSSAGTAMEATNEAGSVASQALLNIRTVNAFSLEESLAVKFEKYLVKPLAQFIRKGMVTGAGMGFGQFVILSGAGLAYWVGGQLILMDRATFPQVMAVILTIMFGAVGLGQLSADASDKAEATVAAQKIQTLWRAKTKIYAMGNEEGVIPTDTHGEIVIRDVTFAYPMRPEKNVYNGVNITIEAGQTVAFVGPSGCGKSTAVSLIERFYDPLEGAVLLDGTDIRTIHLGWLRKQIGLVSQEPVLFSGTLFENIAQGKDGATLEEVEAAARMANAHDFISAFPTAYQTLVGERGIQLSGGQKQRIAIARAIVRDPKILILDEATSALDTASERIVQEALDNLLQAKKRTTIVIAHRLSTIRNADKIVVLMDGVVVEQGTHEELMISSAGHYRDLVRNSQHESNNIA